MATTSMLAGISRLESGAQIEASQRSVVAVVKESKTGDLRSCRILVIIAIVAKYYLQLFLRYWTLSILGSRVSPFGVK